MREVINDKFIVSFPFNNSKICIDWIRLVGNVSFDLISCPSEKLISFFHFDFVFLNSISL